MAPVGSRETSITITRRKEKIRLIDCFIDLFLSVIRFLLKTQKLPCQE